MSKSSVLVSSWLAASVRALLKRTDALEQELKRTKKKVVFNHMAPAFFPSIPPGVHAPAADVQFAAALSHVLYTTEPVSLPAKVFNDEIVYDCFMNEPTDNTKCLSPHEFPAGLPLSRIAAADNFDLDLQTFDNEHFLQISKNKPSIAKTFDNEVSDRADDFVANVVHNVTNNPLPDDGGGLLNISATTSELATTNELAVAALFKWLTPAATDP